MNEIPQVKTERRFYRWEGYKCIDWGEFSLPECPFTGYQGYGGVAHYCEKKVEIEYKERNTKGSSCFLRSEFGIEPDHPIPDWCPLQRTNPHPRDM